MGRAFSVSIFVTLCLLASSQNARAAGCHLNERPEFGLSYVSPDGNAGAVTLADQVRAARTQQMSRSCPAETPTPTSVDLRMIAIGVTRLIEQTIKASTDRLHPVDSPPIVVDRANELSRPPRHALAR